MRSAPALLIAGALACAPGNRRAGEPCQDDDCAPGTICAVVDSTDRGERLECITLCEPRAEVGRCDTGEVCWIARGDRLDWGCFPGNDVRIGDPCTYAVGCERGAVCGALLGRPLADPEELVCTPVCDPGGCGAGEPCFFESDCAVGTACGAVGTSGTLRDASCVPTCTSPDAAASRPSLCDDGSLCYLLCESCRRWGCYPGGPVPIGGECAFVADCERGAICASSGRCVRACDSDTDCRGQTCRSGLCGP